MVTTNAVLEERIVRTDHKVDRLEHTMYGNGQDGVLIRLDRIEQLCSKRTRSQLILESIAVVLLGALVGKGIF